MRRDNPTHGLKPSFLPSLRRDQVREYVAKYARPEDFATRKGEKEESKNDIDEDFDNLSDGSSW